MYSFLQPGILASQNLETATLFLGTAFQSDIIQISENSVIANTQGGGGSGLRIAQKGQRGLCRDQPQLTLAVHTFTCLSLETRGITMSSQMHFKMGYQITRIWK